jgi:hypothetical protein
MVETLGVQVQKTCRPIIWIRTLELQSPCAGQLNTRIFIWVCITVFCYHALIGVWLVINTAILKEGWDGFNFCNTNLLIISFLFCFLVEKLVGYCWNLALLLQTFMLKYDDYVSFFSLFNNRSFSINYQWSLRDNISIENWIKSLCWDSLCCYSLWICLMKFQLIFLGQRTEAS